MQTDANIYFTYANGSSSYIIFYKYYHPNIHIQEWNIIPTRSNGKQTVACSYPIIQCINYENMTAMWLTILKFAFPNRFYITLD